MGNALNPAITDLKTFVLYAVVPFNLLKGTIVSAMVILIYKKLSPILHR
jgi:riboflavin transporter FmnP